jgi:glycosyltransferase involved in cell wall biosynthesis
MSDKSHCDVSVIIPAYRAADYIDRAVQSVFRQTVHPKELIIVDDGSDDETSEILESYSETDSPIELKILHQSNQGAGAARNLALQFATGKFVAFLDSDDEWLPEKLARSIFHMEQNKFILVAHNIFIVNGEHQKTNNIALRFQKSSNSLFHGLYRRGFISTSTVVASLSSIRHAGGFDTSLQAGQDFDLWLKMLGPQGSPFVVFDECLAKYYVRDESITRRADSRLSCTIEIARRHAPLLRQHSGSPTISLWFRLVAVHYEAIRAHLNSKKHLSAIRVFLRAPAVIVIETLRLANRFS